MKKHLMKLIAYMLSPVLLAGHYFTGHTAFLFVLSFLSVLAIITCALTLWFLDDIPDEKLNEILKEHLNHGYWKYALENVVGILISVYLLYSNSFVTATFYIIAFMFGYVVRKTLHGTAKEHFQS